MFLPTPLTPASPMLGAPPQLPDDMGAITVRNFFDQALTLFVDDSPYSIPPRALVLIPVTPGRHSVRAVIPGRPDQHSELDIEVGTTQGVMLR